MTASEREEEQEELAAWRAHEERRAAAAGADGLRWRLRARADPTRFITAELREHRERLAERLRSLEHELPDRGRRIVRKALTGHPEKRVRDYVKVPRVARTIDKASFTAGVVGVLVSQYVTQLHPRMFWLWYCVSVGGGLGVRTYSYKAKKWHYFMYDFCYFVNALCFVGIFAAPRSLTLFRVLFCLSNGPLLSALVAWRNSLVFHDLDKVTSVYIHAAPSLLTWCWRWNGQTGSNFGAAVDELSLSGLVGWPLLAYVAWQVMYLVKTEWMDARLLDSDPSLMTSLRWLAVDSKQPMNRLALRSLRSCGMMGATENFDARTIKTKLTFVCLQMLYTLVTLAPVPLLYANVWVHTLTLVFSYLCVTWNGASYYIEVFSRRYNLQFKDDEDEEDDRAEGGGEDPDDAPGGNDVVNK